MNPNYAVQCVHSHVLFFATPGACSLLGSSVHGDFQARTLEWVAISFSKESSNPGIKTMSPASVLHCRQIHVKIKKKKKKGGKKHFWRGCDAKEHRLNEYHIFTYVSAYCIQLHFLCFGKHVLGKCAYESQWIFHYNHIQNRQAFCESKKNLQAL